ncbi:sulfotransferase family 2 domain-containing protein, partial [Priestia megaterium]
YTYFTMMRNPIERVISLYYFLKTYPGYYRENMENMSFEDYIDWDPQAKNGQIQQICGIHSQIGLEKAKENLKTFKVVGITEMFNESLLLLKDKLGWNDIAYKRKNVTKSRPLLQEVPTEIIKKIKKNNQLDIELYEFAKSDLIKQLSDLKGSPN